MLTKKELGIPWYKACVNFIDDKDGIMVARVHKDFTDRLDFIILAANNYHALVGLLAEINCSLNNMLSQDDSMELQDRIEALLPTHTQQEATEGDVFVINKDDDDWHDIVVKCLNGRLQLSHYRNPVTDVSLIDAIESDNCEIVGNIKDNPALGDDLECYPGCICLKCTKTV